MLNSLTLTNFMQHEDLTISFTGGLNVLRGSNEAGKSSIFNGIAYAYYGARALPMSLEDTVTWGKPANSLKVALTFTHLNQAYSLTRKKSGAELLGPDDLRVSGQAEVTSFIEKLFGAPLTVAVATMIAGQSQLKESLDGSSVPLIEKLSNMALIDQLVDKVQTNLPSGNTKLFVTQLEGLAELVEPVADYVPLDAAILIATADEFAADDAADVSLAEYELAKTEAVKAGIRLSAASAFDLTRKMLEVQLAKTVITQQQVAPVNLETLHEDELQSLKSLQASEAVTKEKWELFNSLPVPSVHHSRVEAEKEASDFAEKLTFAQRKTRTLELSRAEAKAGIITQSACGLCGKDLTDVPEVVNVNRIAEASIQAFNVEIEVHATAIKDGHTAAGMMLALQKLDNALSIKVGNLVGYVTVDKSKLPTHVTWSGPAASTEPDTENYTARLASLVKHKGLAQVHASQVAQATSSIASLQAEMEAQKAPERNPLDAQAAAYADAKLKDYRALAALQNTARQALGAATFAKASAVQAHTFALERHALGVAKRLELASLIESYNVNNRLIAKLRDARPVVARKLWGSVLAAVSTYFSTIRGTPSVVTRTDSEFLIDGKSAKAFSGSTKDALGLAIRITLQKTFLGALDTVLVDEPASAADPERESAMLGMLATCGYEQVVLVTHSDLADSFATNIIRI